MSLQSGVQGIDNQQVFKTTYALFDDGRVSRMQTTFAPAPLRSIVPGPLCVAYSNKPD